MERVSKYLLGIALGLLSSNVCLAQEEGVQEQTENRTLAGFFDTSTNEYVDYTSLKLPPLEILFTNAKTSPTIELLAQEEKIAKALLKKQKSDIFSHLNGHGSYSYGIMDNYGSNSSVVSPIYYQYMGSKQHFWNFGASFNFSAEDIIDAKRKVKRQQLEVERAGIQKDIAYEDLKKQIVQLYVRINTNLVSLKTAAENAAAYSGAGMLTDKEFIYSDVSVRDLAETHRWESTAVQEYQNIQAQITIDILTLEIMTHTPIITNVTTDITIDNQ